METNYTKLLWEDGIKQSLQKRRKEGGCGMNIVRIPHMIKLGKWKTLYDWEKEYFLKGIVNGLWDKDGNHLKNNTPYKSKKKPKLNEV